MALEVLLVVLGLLGLVLGLAVAAALVGRHRMRRRAWPTRQARPARGGSPPGRSEASALVSPPGRSEAVFGPGRRVEAVAPRHLPFSPGDAAEGAGPPVEPTRIVPRRLEVSGALQARRRVPAEPGDPSLVGPDDGVGDGDARLLRRLRLVRDTALVVFVGSLVALVLLLPGLGRQEGVASLTGAPPSLSGGAGDSGAGGGGSGPTTSLLPPATGGPGATPGALAPTPRASAGASPGASLGPTATPTANPTATASASPVPTATPTSSPTPSPSPPPSPSPTPEPTSSPTPEPSPPPSATAEPSPSPESSPSP
jgi:hypothetical protein